MSVSPMRRLWAAAEFRASGLFSMARSSWLLHGWDRAQSIPIAVPDPSRVPVIFCTWKRLERLSLTLEMLAAQDIGVQALIWDNSGQPEIVSKAVADASIVVAVHQSPRNVGGFGRFYLARAAAEAGHEAVVLIDDDQDLEPGAVRKLLGAHGPKSISGGYAWRFTGRRYDTRERCGPGEAAHYLGTGGMVADPGIFTDPRVFACPRRYWFVEDLWLCFVAQHFNGYALSCNPIELGEVADSHNQSTRLWWVKNRLRRYMARRGWPGSLAKDS